MDYMHVDNIEDFNRKYRGIEKVSHANLKNPDRPAYLADTSLNPINDKADSVQRYASYAYHGGYNSCSEVGYFPQETYDYDLKMLILLLCALCLILTGRIP
ncbi:hypothetical protein NIA73_00300 [Anaerobutyricum hallii]|nr:hypothetical protein [Anaerobutyricum hallii]